MIDIALGINHLKKCKSNYLNHKSLILGLMSFPGDDKEGLIKKINIDLNNNFFKKYLIYKFFLREGTEYKRPPLGYDYLGWLVFKFKKISETEIKF